ncbi:MAG: putative Na+/H+ antiporter [Vicinamibacterales bacterium]
MTDFPRAIDAYPSASDQTLAAELAMRAQLEPFNVVATSVFLLAIVHTLFAARFALLAHRTQSAHDERAREAGRPRTPSIWAEVLHFGGEVELVFGVWAVVLIVAATAYHGWDAAKHYVNEGVNYSEALFVVVIMALASTRPIIGFAESTLRRVAGIGGATPGAWWVTILTLGPLLGSFITEPAAMTICAMLLARQFFDLQPSPALKYATLGVLFVNVSIGGTLTHFAAPPILMVARPWSWDIPFMMSNFGLRAVLAIALSTACYALLFRREMRRLATCPPVADVECPAENGDGMTLLPVPAWVVAAQMLCLAWTVFTAHYPAFLIGGFLFFIGFTRATAPYQSQIELKTPLLVGMFLAGLVIHGGLQGWWIAPVLSRLSEVPLFLGATALTAFNDNALITYLATLVPSLSDSHKLAVVRGAVVGGGLTVIANAPNPAGQALLSRFFGGAISPLGLLAGALLPTLIAVLVFGVP